MSIVDTRGGSGFVYFHNPISLGFLLSCLAALIRSFMVILDPSLQNPKLNHQLISNKALGKWPINAIIIGTW